METELQMKLMKYIEVIKSFGVPDLLISRFERTAIKRYEEMKWEKLGNAIEKNKIQEQIKESVKAESNDSPKAKSNDFAKEPKGDSQ